MRESFVESPLPCHLIRRRKKTALDFKAPANPVEDHDKADIIGGSDLHIGVDESLNSNNDKIIPPEDLKEKYIKNT